MKVAVIGSRGLVQFPLSSMLHFIPPNTTELVSGGARGADRLAEEAAQALQLPITRFLPNYAAYGRTAPVLRNHTLLDYADYVLAFWDMTSPGTRGAVLYCLHHHIPVRVIPTPNLPINNPQNEKTNFK